MSTARPLSPRPQSAPGSASGSGPAQAGQDRALGRWSRCFAYALPLLEPPFISTPDTDFGGVLFTVAIYVLVALGLNIVVGYAGLLDLGYVGFYAVGAYTVGVLTSEHATLAASCWRSRSRSLATMISGVLLGAPTLRVRGDYLAIVTLGFGEIIRLIADQLRVARRRRRHQRDPAAARASSSSRSRTSTGRRARRWSTSTTPRRSSSSASSTRSRTTGWR